MMELVSLSSEVPHFLNLSSSVGQMSFTKGNLMIYPNVRYILRKSLS